MCRPQMVPIRTWTATRNIVGHGMEQVSVALPIHFSKRARQKAIDERGRPVVEATKATCVTVCGAVRPVIRVLNETFCR